jgi:hypothetical protein
MATIPRGLSEAEVVRALRECGWPISIHTLKKARLAGLVPAVIFAGRVTYKESDLPGIIEALSRPGDTECNRSTSKSESTNSQRNKEGQAITFRGGTQSLDDSAASLLGQQI